MNIATWIENDGEHHGENKEQSDKSEALNGPKVVNRREWRGRSVHVVVRVLFDESKSMSLCIISDRVGAERE